MDGSPTLSPDFREFVALLDAHKVEYLVVGGYAVAAYGHPRYTKDLDVWVAASTANAERLLEALDAFGFGTVGLTVDDFAHPDSIIQLGQPPNRIDLLTTLSGVTFETCYDRRTLLSFGELNIPFIDLDSLKQNKRTTGRTQDLADIEGLEE